MMIMIGRTQMILIIIIKINNDDDYDDANEVKLIESGGAGLIR